MYFDAVVVFVTNSSLLFRLAVATLWYCSTQTTYKPVLTNLAMQDWQQVLKTCFPNIYCDIQQGRHFEMAVNSVTCKKDTFYYSESSYFLSKWYTAEVDNKVI